MSVTVNFKNYDGSVLQTLTVESGETPAYTGETPTKAKDSRVRYEFSGWDPAVGPVTEDTDYTAQYTSIPFSVVSFLNSDGSVLSSAEYDVGTLAANIVLPPDPTKPATQKYTYTFSRWTPDIHDVDENDQQYAPIFTGTINKYGVTFMDDDGTTVLKAEVEYNYGTAFENVVQPDVPNKPVEGSDISVYRFHHWDPDPSEVVDDIVYTAVYVVDEKKKYMITFVDEDGAILEQKEFFEDDTPAYDGPENCMFTYDPAIEEVSEDATYEVSSTKMYEVLKMDQLQGPGYRKAAFLVADDYDEDDLPEWAASGSVAIFEGDDVGYMMKQVDGTWVECADTIVYLLIMAIR